MLTNRGATPSGLGAYDPFWWKTSTAPIITVQGGAPPSSPIMQVATSVSSDPDLPPNIQAGGCSQLLPGFTVGAGNYIFAPDGTNTGDWISPDNQRLFSSGLPLCHAGGYQDLGVPTVLSIPDDLLEVLRNCGVSSASLRAWEGQVQAMCVQSQTLTSWQSDTGAALGQLWLQAQDILQSAAATVANADQAYAAFVQADAAAKGAYSNGNYADSSDGAFVLRVLQDYNHAALAWPNIQAAASCVQEEFLDWCRTIAQDFGYRYRAMARQAGAVSSVFEGVQAIVQQMQDDSNDVGGMSPAANNAVAQAAPLLNQLNELAGQIAAVFAEASTWDGRVTNAIQADPPDWQTLLDADAWILTAQEGPFPDAPNRASSLASSIHGLLDGEASKLHDYLIQHPELVGQGKAGAKKSSTGKIVAGVGAVGVLALLVKKGLLFG